MAIHSDGLKRHKHARRKWFVTEAPLFFRATHKFVSEASHVNCDTRTHARTNTHARAHTRAHTHTHTHTLARSRGEGSWNCLQQTARNVTNSQVWFSASYVTGLVLEMR